MNPSHFIICNRAGLVTRDGWIHIVPRGELPNREAGVIQVLDDAALAAIVRNIEADRTRLGDRWPGIYAGREHFIYNDEKDSAALAWFAKFETRADGLWASEDGLTPAGVEALRNKTYKFTSFVADRASAERLAPAATGTPRLRITRLDTVGFTNQANGKELLSPISNRGGADARPADETPKTKPMKSVATVLGLSEDAAETAVLAEVTKLKNRAESAERELTPIKNRVSQLETQVATQAAAQVEADLAPLLNRTGALAVKPEVLASFRTQLLANREQTLPAFLAFVAALGSATAAPAPLTNRSTAGHPNGAPGTAADLANPDTAAGFATVIKNRAATVKKADALTAAIAQHPAGYAAWRAANGQPGLE